MLRCVQAIGDDGEVTPEDCSQHLLVKTKRRTRFFIKKRKLVTESDDEALRKVTTRAERKRLRAMCP